jgi:Protein of unknown function (DUF3182)
MGTVVTYAPQDGDGVTEHEIAARVAVAKALAGLKGFEFGGGYTASMRRNGALYFVPSTTLLSDEARALGIRGEEDLFGGVVPYPFVATKSIAHPLAGPGAHKPEGWSEAFAERVRDVVLPGFTAFTREDAREAARTLLEDGPVRIKHGRGMGGKGQMVIERAADLAPALDAINADELAENGLVLEPNLGDLTTYSVGQVCVGAMRASYCGTQKATRNNGGELVYGGSDLLLVRGTYDELARLSLPPEVQTAIRQAQTFDAAAKQFDGMFASRRNYDVLRGRDARGRWHCGVLEQSWRIGGASGPEVAALEAFRADPRLRAVHARSTESYGADAKPPAGAIVHFHGVDSRAGPLTKYTLVEPYEAAR